MNFAIAIPAFLCLLTLAAQDEAILPRAGETALTSAQAQQALQQIAEVFKANPIISARIIAEEDDDILGRRKIEGALLLDRDGRVLRKFSQPACAQLLDGDKFSEYLPTAKKLHIKDFSKAPRMLKLLRAALTADVKALSDLFDVHLFSATPNAAEKAVAYRVVLIKKAEGKEKLPYRRIQGQIQSGALFFSQIEYAPEDGTPKLEHFVDVKKVEQPHPDAFTLKVPEGVERRTDVIEAEAQK